MGDLNLSAASHRFGQTYRLLFIIFLSIDVWKALWFTDAATGKQSFGLGVGTLVLAVNVVLLGGYTFGCHSLRHLVGGFMDRLTGAPVKRMAIYAGRPECQETA